LTDLLNRGLVSNDRFDVIRTGNAAPVPTVATAIAAGR
jgi:hypothetical protein